MSLTGHLWTLGAYARRHIVRPVAPAGEPWRTTLADPVVGPVDLSGCWSPAPRSHVAVVVVHGMGGSIDAGYMAAGAAALARAGAAVLRLNLRGSDRQGGDFYHAGLTADLHAAAASPELAPYPSLCILGYSLGGHLALRYAAEPGDRRLAAVAAVCSPLDLAYCARAIDRAESFLYRHYLLGRLKEIYEAVARRRPVPTPVERVRRARSLQEFDGLTVAPRHGFASAADYYARASAGPVLRSLRVPALWVAAEEDPMVPAGNARSWIPLANGHLDARWVRPAGHLGFPAHLDLGTGGAPGLESQLAAWLLSRFRGGGS